VPQSTDSLLLDGKLSEIPRLTAETARFCRQHSLVAEVEFQLNLVLEGEALRSLIRQGILRHEKSKRLWIIDVERFPLVDNRPQQDVRLRLADAILSDIIPDTRDIMLVSIAEPCGLLGYVLTEAQLSRRRQRIQMLCNLETISRQVAGAINALDATLHQGIPRMM